MARKAQAPEPRMKPARDTGAGFCAEGLCAGRPARTEFSREHVLNSRSPVFFLLFTGARPRRRVPSGMHRGRNRRQHASSRALGTPLGACGLPAIFCCRGGESSGSMCNFLASRACSPHHRAINLESQLRRVFCSPDWRRDHRNGGVGFSAFHRGCLAAQYHQNLWLDADCIRRQAIGAGMRPDRSLHASRALPR